MSKSKLRIMVYAAAIALLCGCSTEPPARTPEKIRSEGIFRVAASSNSDYPYLYWDESGQAQGIEPKVMRHLAAALQAEAEFIPYKHEDVAGAVTSGLADIGIAGFTEDGVRGRLLETVGYYHRRYCVLTRRGESYPYESILSGRTILSDFTCNFSFATQTTMDSAVSKLLDGTADAVICDAFAARTAVEESNEALQAEYYRNAYERVYVAAVAARNQKLYAFIDAELTELVATSKVGTLADAVG